MDETKVLEAAIETYGADAQLIIALEELSELQKELCKNLRGRDNVCEIAEEIADVEIMLGQLKLIFSCADGVSEWKSRKLSRLVERIKKGK